MRRDGGFTLAEVLVAATIAGVLIASVTEVTKSSLERSQLQLASLRKLVQAEALLARLGLDIRPRIGTSRVVFSDGSVGMVQISPNHPGTSVADGDVDRIELRRATISVTSGDGRDGVRIETLVAADVTDRP